MASGCIENVKNTSKEDIEQQFHAAIKKKNVNALIDIFKNNKDLFKQINENSLGLIIKNDVHLVCEILRDLLQVPLWHRPDTVRIQVIPAGTTVKNQILHQDIAKKT